MKRKSVRGFSLIELLVVVSIILVIAAIAIPNLLKAKGSAQAASAVSTIRAVTSANQVYQNQLGTFAPHLGSLGPQTANLLDTIVSGCTTTGTACATDLSIKSNYTFSYSTTATASDYIIVAVPSTNTISNGLAAYCSDSSGAIMQDLTATHTALGTAGSFGAATATTGCGGDTSATGL